MIACDPTQVLSAWLAKWRMSFDSRGIRAKLNNGAALAPSASKAAVELEWAGHVATATVWDGGMVELISLRLRDTSDAIRDLECSSLEALHATLDTFAGTLVAGETHRE
jgi:hypothetical protein